jgi:predicted RNA-binding protein YlxR (DUF448 family)
VVRRPGSRAGGRGVVATATATLHALPPEAAGETPQRRCIVTGETRDRGSLLRCVVGPDGEIVPDINGRLPGRGLWLLPRRDIVDRAVAKRLFARAARQPVTVPPGLTDRIEALLARRCGETLGLARRAGLAVAGFERVGEAVRRGNAALLLFALDGAVAGQRKLATMARGVPSIAALTAAELSGAFGREVVAFAAVGSGPLCVRLRLDLERLVGFRASAVEDRMNIAPVGPGRQDSGTEEE